MSPLDGEKGWEILFCEKCGYAIDKSRVTRTWTVCPLCLRKGKESQLVDRYVVHYPENKVLKPKADWPR
jgi:hypothetical protein